MEKILLDPFYGELFQSYGLDYILKAGYFEDGLTNPIDYDNEIKWLCTPFFGLKQNVENPIVLLTTGAMAPAHNGHIDILLKAGKHLKKNGYDVVGGYVSCGHDDYIKEKHNGEFLNIHTRLQLAQEVINEHGDLYTGFINIDPWEGLFNKSSINFTAVIHRLELYLKKYYNPNVKVCYVCGADNARFVNTFRNKGMCVVVGRSKSLSQTDRYIVDNGLFFDNKRTFLIDGNNHISSTMLRKNIDYKNFETTKTKLILRTGGNSKINEYNYVKIFREYFNLVEKNSIDASSVNTWYTYLGNKSVINLDKKLVDNYKINWNTHDIDISRNYDIFGVNQLNFNWLKLKEQLEKIPAGKYHLYDDDICTGSTIRKIKDCIQKYNLPIEIISVGCNITENEYCEILDIWDFKLEDGLVINDTYRAPYLYPYVDPFTRCSINNPIQFSLDIWELNKIMYDSHVNHRIITLKDINPQIADLFRLVGFKNDEISDICDWHINYLKKLL
jgi:nicotinic acid mononucleotide adenylyltransferase